MKKPVLSLMTLFAFGLALHAQWQLHQHALPSGRAPSPSPVSVGATAAEVATLTRELEVLRGELRSATELGAADRDLLAQHIDSAIRQQAYEARNTDVAASRPVPEETAFSEHGFEAEADSQRILADAADALAWRPAAEEEADSLRAALNELASDDAMAIDPASVEVNCVTGLCRVLVDREGNDQLGTFRLMSALSAAAGGNTEAYIEEVAVAGGRVAQQIVLATGGAELPGDSS